MMPENRANAGAGRTAVVAPSARGVTLVDVLVSISVIGLLIGLMVPAISSVRDVTTRTLCSSNIRQLGLGVVMYADDYNGRMPSTAYVPVGVENTLDAETVILRRDSMSPIPPSHHGSVATIGIGHSKWDGIGLLFRANYLDAAGVFYCPAHEGESTLENYRLAWSESDLELVGNYQFRGLGPDGSPFLYRVEPRNAAILTDAFRTADERNHSDGANVLHADLRVTWFPGAPELPTHQDTLHASRQGREIWRTFDSGGPGDSTSP